MRAILKETDGLGTEATRAGIIELLFKRQFLFRSGKHIHASPAGKGLISGLPALATLPDMTARWEMQLNAISRREANYRGFMQPLESALAELVAQSQSQGLSALCGVKAKVKPFTKRHSRKSKTQKKA